VLTFDQRGHGRSRGFDDGIGMDRFGMDLLHVMGYLGLAAAAAFVGFSIGANTLLRLVVRRPDIARALVLIGGASQGPPERVAKITSGPGSDALIDAGAPRRPRTVTTGSASATRWRRTGPNHDLTPSRRRASPVPP
jgi:pimeloyl-ACP methyl ester carboxylesterase